MYQNFNLSKQLPFIGAKQRSTEDKARKQEQEE
jgi:hypothetical protein